MDDLIKALQIFQKYGNPTFPTHCEHDEMFVMIEPSFVTTGDLLALKKLHFEPTGDNTFSSTFFGSA